MWKVLLGVLLIAAVSVAQPVEAEGTSEGETYTSGIEVKRPVFGGACRICPWGAMAEFVQAAMEPYGYDVQVCYNCSGMNAPRIVSEARTPPPSSPNTRLHQEVSPENAPGMGPVDFGAVAMQFFREAYLGIGMYAQDGPRENLRLIANIQDPLYTLVAAKAETGITDLSEIREKCWPVRILTAGAGGADLNSILAHFGLSREIIEEAGGRVGMGQEDTEDFDVVIGGGGPMSTAPEWSIWTELTHEFDLNFIELPEALLAELAEGELERGTIPVGLYPGVWRSIPTLVRSGTVVYGRDDMPDDFAYAVAKAIDEQQQLLQWNHMFFSYNVHNVWKAYEVPLHPGAERYYKEQGYIE